MVAALAVDMRHLLPIASILWLAAVAACVGEDDKEAGAWSPGKGDGRFDIIEAGPAPVDEARAIALDHRVPAFRIETFGNAKLDVDLKGKDGADAYVVIEGPLDGGGDGVAAGAGRVAADDDDGGYGRNAQLRVTLAEPGVYRILTGTYESMALGDAPTGTVELAVTCSAGCERPAIDQKTFVRTLEAAAGGREGLRELARGQLAEMLHDPALAEQVAGQLDAILASPDLAGLERFPTIPMSMIDEVRPALGLIEAEPPRPDDVVTGDLAQLLGPCSPTRGGPDPIDPRLPGVGYGHFANRTLSPCQAAHATKLAQILTSLAANNGSSVTYKGQSIATPRALFDALAANGHAIETRNERTYANFVSLTLGDKDVIWPVWLDTGLALSSGGNLTIPVGHSHHAWRIVGPTVDTRVMFYLGTSGAGFFGQTQIRPAWTGDIVSMTSADRELALATVDAAASYLRRNRTERTTVAAGMPADGYGFVGVCNDSNATIEYVTRRTITTFPLLRAAQLDSALDLNDGLDDAVRALPKDGDGIADARDALRRAVEMQPFAPDSPKLFDAGLGAQLATALRDLGQ
jgi:hypothetical protein